MFTLDIVAMDEALGKLDSDYNPMAAKYKGEPCSMKEYIQQKWGSEYVAIIEALNTKETVILN